jgi:cobaltochelatase CobN
VRGYAHHKPGAPWIAVPFYRASLVAGQTLPLAAIVARLEASGYNVVPVFGYPYETPLKLLLDETARAALT